MSPSSWSQPGLVAVANLRVQADLCVSSFSESQDSVWWFKAKAGAAVVERLFLSPAAWEDFQSPCGQMGTLKLLGK